MTSLNTNLTQRKNIHYQTMDILKYNNQKNINKK